MLAIRTHGLTRRFPGGHGVEDLELAVPDGAVYGFLGPNGAGKTTTIRMLLGLLRAQRGTIALHGLALDSRHRGALARVGAMVESPSLYPHLSGRQNLEVTRRLLGAPAARIDEALEVTGMAAHAGRRVRDYSLGMRQRLAIALALLNRPRLLVLDEPANGLDPAGILDMRRLLRALATEHGITVFVSSHQLGEVEQVASHVGVLHEGRLRFQGTMAELRARQRPRVQLRCDDAPRAAALLSAAGEAVDHHGDGLLAIPLAARAEAELNRLLVEAGLAVSHLAREQASLESLFFDVTGRPAGVAA
jgi:ABC-2 type transport system ATP-binding protein